jgi:hypothetical protein
MTFTTQFEQTVALAINVRAKMLACGESYNRIVDSTKARLAHVHSK